MSPVLRTTAAWLLAWTLLAPLDSLDHRIVRGVQSGRSPWLDPVMQGATSIGQSRIVLGTLFIATLVTGAPGLVTARTVLVALAPTNLVVEGLKRATQRTRPDGRTDRRNASFPSSHAANAFALACVLTTFRPKWRIPCLAAAALVAWSRVYLNRHYVSDVLVGAAIGSFFGIWAARWAAGPGRRWVEHRLGRSAGKAARPADDAPVRT